MLPRLLTHLFKALIIARLCMRACRLPTCKRSEPISGEQRPCFSVPFLANIGEQLHAVWLLARSNLFLYLQIIVICAV